jgi:hypothetical protein
MTNHQEIRAEYRKCERKADYDSLIAMAQRYFAEDCNTSENNNSFLRWLSIAARNIIHRGGLTKGLVEITDLYAKLDYMERGSALFCQRRLVGYSQFETPLRLKHGNSRLVSVNHIHTDRFKRQRESADVKDVSIDVLCFGITTKPDIDVFRPWIFLSPEETEVVQYLTNTELPQEGMQHAYGRVWDGFVEQEYARQTASRNGIDQSVIYFSVLTRTRNGDEPVFSIAPSQAVSLKYDTLETMIPEKIRLFFPVIRKGVFHEPRWTMPANS